MTLRWLDPGVPDALSARLVERFDVEFAACPDACATAPGRVNLIGEHVDYNDGRCLPIALPHATYAALRQRDDDVIHVRSLQRSDTWSGHVDRLGPGEVDGWASYVAGVVWALRQRGIRTSGLDVLVDGAVPVGAGLSSSAALECSVAVAVCAALGLDLDDDLRKELARACMRAEIEVAGAPTGGLDQTVSLFGRDGHALLLDCASGETEQVPWDPSATGHQLLVVDTGASHDLTDGGYAARRADCETAARTLGVRSLRDVGDPEAALGRLSDERVRRRARHVLTEMARVTEAVAALRCSDHTAFGAAMTASHASLRDDFEVSCPELDAAVGVSLDHGALGARMTGGGFGGSAIALVPAARVEELARAVAATYADRGWPAPAFLVARASTGARALPTALG